MCVCVQVHARVCARVLALCACTHYNHRKRSNQLKREMGQEDIGKVGGRGNGIFDDRKDERNGVTTCKQKCEYSLS